MDYSILKRPAVEKLTGLSRSSIYAKMQVGEFPQPIILGSNSVGWYSREIDEWLKLRVRRKPRPVKIKRSTSDSGGAHA